MGGAAVRVDVSNATARPSADALSSVARTLLAERADTDAWDVVVDDTWCHVTPAGQGLRPQGWKLHVSATLGSVRAVLAAALPVLFEHGCAVKFAATEAVLAQLNSARAPRASSGKVLTAYPGADEDLPHLAEQLHRATVGLDGPRILSDRPYAPGSLVHYRYGAFVQRQVLSHDGIYRQVIVDPAGRLVDDRCEARFAPPEWAVSPFPDATGDPSTSRKDASPRGVFLAERFAVRQAIQHSNKGGVYRALDTWTDVDVVVKEARPHIQTTLQHRDVRDVVRAEARLLERLGPLSITPRLVDVFEQGGHVFLAEEFLAGTSLRQWVLDRVRRTGPRRHVGEALSVAGRLAALMDRVHAAGVVLRDFTPNNVMVLPDGELRLIDLELAVVLAEGADESLAGGTPGYGAPEQFLGAAPSVTADYFGLGATVCFLLTGADPYLAEDDPGGRVFGVRLRTWLASGAPVVALPQHLQEAILGLMADDPDRRATSADLQRSLQIRPAAAPVTGGLSVLGDDDWDVAVDGIVGHLLDSRTSSGEEFWPLSTSVTANDPCNVQHGAAGVVGALSHFLQLTGDRRVVDVLAAACSWIEKRVAHEPSRPPGLYFGLAGAAWALHDAGRALGDDEILDRALALARSLPESWPNPDLTHGTAGVGLTFLHLWQETGAAEFLERAHRSADSLVATAGDDPVGVLWQTPASFESLFAGQRSYGFAHGSAGIGYFLLEMARATGRPDCLHLAVRAGETLLTTATTDGAAARWPSGPGVDLPMPYWCHGSAGVGALLIRLHAATGQQRFRALAEMAAQAVRDHAWGGPLGQCHGIAGNAEFLLDMADVLPTHSYAAQASGLAGMIFDSRVYRSGRIVFPDDEREVSAEWAGGLSGVLCFLLRLRYGGPRRWMVDDGGRGVPA